MIRIHPNPTACQEYVQPGMKSIDFKGFSEGRIKMRLEFIALIAFMGRGQSELS
jgi:hypothetical protein